uniref:C-type lectin domain-containing protein n=1 Tax=Arion vulgaris TaxID=1028688 RepID=A0A0B7B1A1_9EUPU
MAAVGLCIVVSVLISTVSTNLCDIGEDVGSKDTHEYFSLEMDNNCYIFAQLPLNIKPARNYCRSLGGHLTDVESLSENKLQEYIKKAAQNRSAFERDYWIGLFYSDDLKLYYWDNGGADAMQVTKVETDYYFSSTKCITMSSKKVIDRGCDGKYPFICKLNLGCVQDNQSMSNECSPRCRTFIRNFKSTTTSQPVTEHNSTDGNTTDPVPTKHVPDNGSVTEKQNQQCNCSLHTEKMTMQTTIMLAVLGSIIPILIAALLISFVIICRYRRVLNKKGKSQRISMVDILKADNGGTRNNRHSGDSNSLPASTSELMYSTTDPAYSAVTEDNGKTPQSPDVYGNISMVHGKNMGTYPASAPLPSATPSSDHTQNINYTDYSHLDRGQEDDTAPTSMYGMESANTVVRKKSSQTYESY